MGEVVHKELSYKIVGVLFDVYNELGHEHKEKYIENAVAKGFKLASVENKRQFPYNLKYKEEVVGKYFLDFLVEGKVVLELKVGIPFSKQHLTPSKAILSSF